MGLKSARATPHSAKPNARVLSLCFINVELGLEDIGTPICRNRAQPYIIQKDDFGGTELSFCGHSPGQSNSRRMSSAAKSGRRNGETHKLCLTGCLKVTHSHPNAGITHCAGILPAA